MTRPLIRRRVAAVLLGFALLGAACGTTEEPAVGAPGLIASADRGGLALSDASGEVVASGSGFVSQPTWSRDGRRLVSSVVDTLGGPSVEVRDGISGDVVSAHPAARSYFFFSWRGDGQRIAALGPGVIGTTLDILDGDGRLLSRDAVEGGTVFLAWEPDGPDLLVHRDTSILLLPDGDDAIELGTVGREFQAPAWLPGSRDAMVMVAEGSVRRLQRISVDGPLPGDDVGDPFPPSPFPAWIIVDGAGAQAAVVGAADEGGITAAAFGSGTSNQPVQASRSALEIVDLASGERTHVTGAATLWAEWSPTSDQLLVASVEEDADWARWSVWADGTLTELVGFIPSAVFQSSYMAFGDQYVEQPRLWAPDGSAFTFAGRLEGQETGSAGVVVVGVEAGEGAVTTGGSVAFWSPLDPGS